MRRTWLLILGIAIGAATAGCETYVAPPKALIRGAEGGVLDDPRAPIDVVFSKPIDPSTLAVKIVPYDTDIEGNLADEQVPPQPLTVLFEHDADPGLEDVGGQAELAPDGQVLRITPRTALPVGRRLALLIEPGLADREGEAVRYRQKLLFGYVVRCKDRPTTRFHGGKYFFVLDVEHPIAVQARLWADIDLDPATGRFVGQFTQGVRNRDPGRCSPACSDTEACRTLPNPPGPHCVIPSEKAGSADEYPDYVPLPEPPTGFTFTVPGCVEEQEDGTIAFVNAPADVSIQQPPVSIKALSLTASFAADETGVLRATGSAASDAIFLGTTSSGAGSGTCIARALPEGAWPDGAPNVPYGPSADDGGLR